MNETKKNAQRDTDDMAYDLSVDLSAIAAEIFVLENYYGGLADSPGCIDRISDEMLAQALMGVRRAVERAVDIAEKIADSIGAEQYDAYKMGKVDALGTGAAVIANTGS